MGVEKRGAAHGEPVQVWGLHHRMPAEMADPVILIVDGDEEDVWLLRLGRMHRDEKKCEKESRAAVDFQARLGAVWNGSHF